MEALTGSGRIARLPYFGINLAIAAVVVAVFIATASENAAGEMMISPVILPVGLLAFYLNVCNVLRRLHDRNHTGLVLLLGLVPLVNFALALYLLFAPGDQHANRYGSPPSSSSDLETQLARAQAKAAFDDAAPGSLAPPSDAPLTNEDGTFNVDGLFTGK